MTSLEQIFKGLGNSIKNNLTNRDITVSETAGFKTIMNKIFDLIDTKVDAESGKGLSTNDYTTSEKTKLANIEENAQVNDIEVIKVNGTAQTITNKSVDIEVPAQAQADWNETDATNIAFIKNKPSIPDDLSDLNDDATHRLVTDIEKATWSNKSDFSGSYNDLSDTPTIPSQLSQLSEDSTHRIVTDAEKTSWSAKLDSSALNDYYTETEVDTKLDAKVDKVTGKGLSTEDYTTAEKTKLAGLENYDDSEIKADITTLENDKQDVLIDSGSGANFKTINNTSLLESGNITLQTPLTADTDYLTPSTATSTYQPKGDYATLVGGTIPESQLPSYVDDVVEGYYDKDDDKFYKNVGKTQAITAETGKIYIDISGTTPKTYRYGGTAYVPITSGNVIVVNAVQDGNENAVSSDAVHDEIYNTVIGSGFEAYISG